MPDPRTEQIKARAEVAEPLNDLELQLAREGQTFRNARWLATVSRIEALEGEREALRGVVTAQAGEWRKVLANFNKAHQHALDRKDGVGTSWLNVQSLANNALAALSHTEEAGS
jgi:hypothetical protein